MISEATPPVRKTAETYCSSPPLQPSFPDWNLDSSKVSHNDKPFRENKKLLNQFGWQIPFDVSPLELSTINYAGEVEKLSTLVSQGCLSDEQKVSYYRQIVLQQKDFPSYTKTKDLKSPKVIPNRAKLEVDKAIYRIRTLVQDKLAFLDYENERNEKFNELYKEWYGEIIEIIDGKVYYKQGEVGEVYISQKDSLSENGEVDEALLEAAVLKARKEFFIPSQ